MLLRVCYDFRVEIKNSDRTENDPNSLDQNRSINFKAFHILNNVFKDARNFKPFKDKGASRLLLTMSKRVKRPSPQIKQNAYKVLELHK